MTELDFEFTSVVRKKTFVRALWMYYLYIYTPRIIRMVFSAAICLVLSQIFSGEHALVLCVAAGMAFVVTLAEFPVFCFRMLGITSKLGVFDRESCWHLYSDKVYSRCGDNESTTAYSCFSGYFQIGNVLILTVGNNLFSSCFSIKLLDGHLPELISCLENAGVKHIRFFAVKRWLFTAVMVLILTLCLLV